MSSYSRRQLEDWLKTIKVKGSVVDIGGSQKPVEGRIQADKDTEFHILDLEEPHERNTEPDIKTDLNEFLTHMPTKNGHSCGRFDTAFCLEVSEYWWNPVLALKNINHLLKNKGILYISFHFIYPPHKPFDQDYLRYTSVGAVKLLEETGFKVEEITMRTTEIMPPATLYFAELMRGDNESTEIGCLIKARKYE